MLKGFTTDNDITKKADMAMAAPLPLALNWH